MNTKPFNFKIGDFITDIDGKDKTVYKIFEIRDSTSRSPYLLAESEIKHHSWLTIYKEDEKYFKKVNKQKPIKKPIAK